MLRIMSKVFHGYLFAVKIHTQRRGGCPSDVEGPALQRVLGLDAALQDKICKHANQKKSNAKQAQEQSDKIHMCVMLRAKPMEVCATLLGSPSRPRRPELTGRVGAAG